MRLKQPHTEDSSARQSILDADPRWQLTQRIAQSPLLARANQLRDILLFVVQQSILEPDEPVHESVIAHQVLGRRKDFNPLDDNIVRVQMAHLRKKLHLYFRTEGSEEETVLSIALGSYKPVFASRQECDALVPQASTSESSATSPAANALKTTEISAETPPGHVFPRRAFYAAAIAAGTLFCFCVLLGIRVYEQQQTIREIRTSISPWKAAPAVAALWRPFFDSPHDTDVILGDNSLLLIEQLNQQFATFNAYLSRSYLADVQNSAMSPRERFVQHLIASKSLGANSEFKLAQRLMAQDPLNKRVRLYGSRQYLTSLLKQNNVVVIGGVASNPWEGLFDDRLNFKEGMQFVELGTSSVINRSPKPGEQPVYVSSDSVGWCVIAYLPNTAENTMALLLEGTGAEATEAAGDFLLSEEQLAAFQKKIGAKDFPPFELLLRISQVKGTPLTATIEAYRTYPAAR